MANADVTIAATDYMIRPGSYKARDEGKPPDAKLGRQTVDDFAGGARLGKLLGCGCAVPAPWPIGPAMVGPSPAAQTVSGSITAAAARFTATDTTYLFTASNAIFRWTRAVGTAFVNRKAVPSNPTGMTRLRSKLYLAYGSSTDVGVYDDATNVLTASALGAGVKAQQIWSWAGALVLQDPANLSRLLVYYGATLATLAQFDLAGNIISAEQLGTALIIATDAGAYQLTGSPAGTITCETLGLAATQLQSADDYAWLVNCQGKLVTWLGHRVVILTPVTDHWTPTGLEGATSYSAAVVGGFLFVSLSPRGASTTYQLWAYDGAGWWMIDQQVAGSNPFVTLSADGGGHLVAWANGGTTTKMYDPDDVTTAANQSSPWSITTPLLDAGAPDRQKHWRRIGVELLRPDGQTVGTWLVAIEWSTNAGLTWSTTGTTNTSGSQQTISVNPDTNAAQLLVRVTLTRSTGLPPFIGAVWAEYETLNDATRRRAWSFDVRATDRTLWRDGTADPRTGEQIAAALWSAYTSGGTILFKPPEYGAEAVTYNTRFVSLVESWERPADQSTIGRNSTLAVSLVEV